MLFLLIIKINTFISFFATAYLDKLVIETLQAFLLINSKLKKQFR